MPRFLFATFTAALFCHGAFGQCTPKSGTIVDETWSRAGSPYCIVGNILVSRLTIAAGVRVEFHGPYDFEIAGTLSANGLLNDSIRFVKADTVSSTRRWSGIFFNSGSSSSTLAFCVVSGSQNSGIRIVNASPTIRRCRISENSSASQGGGLTTSGSLIALDTCEVSNNSVASGNFRGGGIYLSSGAMFLNCCTVSNNTVGGSAVDARGGGVYAVGRLVVTNSTVERNTASAAANFLAGRVVTYGGGLFVDGDLRVSCSTIRSNISSATNSNSSSSFATGAGGGAYANGKVVLTSTLLSYNRALASANAPSRVGGGLYADVVDSSSSISNVSSVSNENIGIQLGSGRISVKNSIAFFNTPRSGAGQISGNVLVSASDVERPEHIDSLFPGVGNINRNPIFLDSTSLRIVSNSPCVDRGDSGSTFNDACLPPAYGSLRNDMGAHGGPDNCGWRHLINTISEGAALHPLVHTLSQNYPNPFNPQTTIRFALPAASGVTLKVFDLLGREVATIVNEKLQAGSFETTWDASGFASGVYLYRLQAGGFGETKKLLLLR